MARLYEFTSSAAADLESIFGYIAADNFSAAIRVEEAVYEACNLMARHPFFGSVRPEITHRRVRFWPVTRFPRYTIVYRPETRPLEIVAVLHSKRDRKRVLAARETR